MSKALPFLRPSFETQSDFAQNPAAYCRPPSSHVVACGGQSIEIARTAAWAISNLARGERTPGTPFLEVAPAIVAALQGSIMSGAPRDDPLRVEAAWVLAFLTAKEIETVSEFVRAGVVPALVRALVDSGGQV